MTMPDDLLHARDAADYVGISWHMLRKYMNHDQFPEPDHRVGTHTTAPLLWYRDTLDQWITDRNAA